MLTQLSIRFPNRVLKGNHDIILKDCFIFGIKSDIRNNIRHFYDDDTVTSQLLVKVCKNEEEDTTSKWINKSAVADFTLGERVDRLIERSN